MKKTLKILSGDSNMERHKIEGLLQHYGVPTRFVDVVDNHWVAIWMGLNKIEKPKKINQYYHYIERSVPLIDAAKGDILSEDQLFQYILLIAVPYLNQQTLTGIRTGEDYIEVDLRKALPSVFLRPHAQHGLVLRKKVHNYEYNKGTDAYDLAPNIIGIIKIRIDRAKEWIGTGELLTQDNLFPSPAYDYGYDVLLTRTDLFDSSEFSIARFV